MQYNNWNLRSQILFCLSTLTLTFSGLAFLGGQSDVAIAQILSSTEHQVNRIPNQPQNRRLEDQEQLLQERQQQFRKQYRQEWNQRRQQWDRFNRNQQQENRSRRRQNQDAVYQRNDLRRQRERNRQREPLIIQPRQL